MWTMKKLKFYEYHQNNSFGKFICNDNLDQIVYIQAYTFDEANQIGESLGMYFDGVDPEGKKDCPCCGNRWCKKTYELDSEFQADLDKTVEDLCKSDFLSGIKIYYYKK